MVSNEDKTGDDILELGHRLADEVKKWIKEWCPKDNFAKYNDIIIFRISFIGHSLGGLIIRAALPELEKYKDKMHSIITLAAPHLGYFLSSSKMVDSGLWLIKKIKKSLALNQLTFSDAKNFEETCIYKLSLCQVYNIFNYEI
jgi:triacylglycerol esterase/lipase EstA (alpha/beta hydrolase family)